MLIDKGDTPDLRLCPRRHRALEATLFLTYAGFERGSGSRFTGGLGTQEESGAPGIAAMLFNALFVFVLIADRGFIGPDRAIPLAVLFVVLAVAVLVGTVAMIKGRAWGAVLIALWTAGLLMWFLIAAVRQNSTYVSLVVLAVATVLAIAVAAGMAREKAAG